ARRSSAPADVPPPRRWPFLDHPGPIPFAHRGGAGDWPENTMPAFEHAVGLGYRYVETDVHATAAGVLVAFHDDVLDRATDRRLTRVRRLAGYRVCTSLGPAGIARLRLASFGARTGRFAAACAQVPTRARGQVLVDERFVATAHRRGLPVHVWTIDDPAEMD